MCFGGRRSFPESRTHLKNLIYRAKNKKNLTNLSSLRRSLDPPRLSAATALPPAQNEYIQTFISPLFPPPPVFFFFVFSPTRGWGGFSQTSSSDLSAMVSRSRAGRTQIYFSTLLRRRKSCDCFPDDGLDRERSLLQVFLLPSQLSEKIPSVQKKRRWRRKPCFQALKVPRNFFFSSTLGHRNGPRTGFPQPVSNVRCDLETTDPLEVSSGDPLLRCSAIMTSC